MKLSVLDQSPISEGQSGADSLRNTLDLARLCDRLGYHRYWVAEHHATPTLACASPEALIGPIAASTDGIRVGSGGVMLPHYSPFKVAETFSALSGLHPNRIDLGLGRAAGTDPLTAFALQRDRRAPAANDFLEQLGELLAHLADELPPDHPFARLPATLPGLPEQPDPWLLGSSPQSGVWAAQLGLPYSFADFINRDGAEIAAAYREHFEPSRWRQVPEVSVGVLAVCAETDAEAERLASSGRMLGRLLRRGRLIPVPPVDTALEFLEREGAGRRSASARRGIVGSPETIRAGFEDVAEEYGADEVLILTITFDHDARKRSYELIADAFELSPRHGGTSAAAVG